MSDSITAILHQLREEFIKQLPARIRAIQDLYQLVTRYNDIRELHRLIHSLTGAAGTHGLSDLTETARELEIRFAGIINEAAMPDSHTREIIDRLLQQLVNLAAQPRQSDEAGISAPSINIANRQSPLIHIVEDDLEQAILLSRALESEGFRTVLFSAAEEFRTALQDEKAEKPAAVIMDMVFPEGDNVGSQLIAEFTAMQNSSVAVLVASVRDDLEARLSAFRAGACRYLTKPYNVSQLVGILDALTGRMPAEAYRILLVDDDPLLLETEAAILQAAGLQVMALSEPLQTLNMVESFNPDVIVLDVYMPYASGPELAAVLRERDNLLQTPILFLSSETDISRQLLALSLGGDDFLVKPIKPEHFVSAVTTRARRARQSKLVQKRLEMTLQEREREHAAVDRHAIVSITDAAGNIISVNDRFCRISGYTRDELLNSNHRMINSGQHPAEFFVNLWQTISAGKIWHGDICNRDKDGGLYWFATTITPYLDAAGAPYQYVAIRTDITSVKEHEKSLETLVESTIAETGQEFFNNAVKGLAKATGTRIAFIAETDPADPAICRIKAMWDGDHLVEQFTYQVAGTPCETLKENTTAVFAEKITGYFPHDSWLQENGIESYIGIALGDVQGRLLGHMAIMDGHPLVENQAHLSLMQLFAARVASEIERLQVEQAVEQTKERLRRGQMYANIGTWEWNIQTNDLYWSERIAPLFGYAEGEVETTYENFLAAVHPEDREAVVNAVNSCVNHNIPYEIEHRVIWQDGTERWLLERGAVIRDETDMAVQMLGVVQDIHDRKRAEMALRESQTKLGGLYSLSPLGIALTDMQGNYLEFNDAFRTISGYPEDELTKLNSQVLVPPEYAHATVQQLATLKETGRYGPYDTVYRRKNGDLVPVRLNGILVRNEQGDAQIWSIVEDIADNKQAEEALIAARDEAERANRAKSEFLSSMSHELRTPMNAILGFGQVLESDAEISEEHRDSVQEIIKAGRHLLELINDVLDLSRVESGHIDLALEPVEVCSIIEDCLSLVKTLANKRDISLKHHAQPGLCVRADRVRMKQALLNLLSNAIKYNRNSGRVELEYRPVADEKVRITVSDTGLGIPHDRLGELFQPFNRLNAAQSEIEGTGIGLALTRNIVEMMGGNVDAQSRYGSGSTFWIELPLESLPESRNQGGANKSRAEQDRPITGHEIIGTILYIEDNPANLKLVSNILARRKHLRLITAHTAQLGIDLAIATAPDLILLDISLPGMDGYELLEIFGSDAGLQHIPVIALTANAMPLDIKRGMEAGFAEYITKPIDINRFLTVIDHFLADMPTQH